MLINSYYSWVFIRHLYMVKDGSELLGFGTSKGIEPMEISKTAIYIKLGVVGHLHVEPSNTSSVR